MKKTKVEIRPRLSPETKELLDAAKNYPEEPYDQVIKRALSSPECDPATNIEGQTPLEEAAYKSKMKRKGVKK